MKSNPGKRPSSFAIIVGFALVYLSWGTTYFPTRVAVYDESMPPLLFGGARIACGGLCLLVYQILRGDGIRLTRADFAKILGVSFFLFIGGSGLMFASNKTINSSVCAVLAATTPLWLGLFAMFWPHGDRLNLRGWLGLVVGLVGVLVLVGPKISSHEEFIKNVGVVMMLGSAACWALGTLILRHVQLRTSHLTTAGYQLLCGGLGLFFTGLLLGEGTRWPSALTPRVVEAFIYLLVFGSLVGFVAYNWLLGHVAAAKVGTYAYVNPIVAIFVGWTFGEEVTGVLFIGIGIILLGVFLIRGGERKRPAVVPPLVEAGAAAEDWQVAPVSEPP